MRSLLASEWTAAAVSVLLVLLHTWWFLMSKHQGDVVSGLGGCLSALGVYVATQPYIRKGLIETAREQAGLHHPGERHERANAREAEAEEEGVRHVIKERVAAAILIAIGSLLNGYGPTIAHFLTLRGDPDFCGNFPSRSLRQRVTA